MSTKIIEKTIAINASPEKVWSVFRDPKVTKKMGWHYVSDWKVGSTFGWKWNDGVLYTHGTIMQLVENSLLQHSVMDEDNRKLVASVITYKIKEKDGKTFLHGKEQATEALEGEDLEEAIIAWEEALEAVKEIAESVK